MPRVLAHPIIPSTDEAETGRWEFRFLCVHNSWVYRVSSYLTSLLCPSLHLFLVIHINHTHTHTSKKTGCADSGGTHREAGGSLRPEWTTAKATQRNPDSQNKRTGYISTHLLSQSGLHSTKSQQIQLSPFFLPSLKDKPRYSD